MSCSQRRIFIYLFFFIKLIPFGAWSQSGNPCGVVAKMTPGNDTIFTSPTVLEIESASENATSYTFLIDNIPHWLTDQPLRVGFDVGLTEVKLVAYNGACTDTAVRYIFVIGSFPQDTTNTTMMYGYPLNNNLVKDLIAVKQGGYLLAGRKVALGWSSELTTPYLVKIKPSGCIDWAKASETLPLVDIVKTEEAADGSFFVAGGEAIAYTPSTYFSSVLMRVSASGDLLWVKHIGNGAEPTENNLQINGMKAMPDGGVVVTGTRNAKSYIVRLDNNGNIIWQKTYDYFGNFYGLDQLLYKDQFLYVGGLLANTLAQHTDGFIAKLDFSNGNVVWLKRYKNSNGYITIRDMHDMVNHILVNVTTPTGIKGQPMIAAYMKIDLEGNVQKAELIANDYVSNSYTFNTIATELVPSGSSFYILSQNSTPLPLQPYISYGTILLKFNSNMDLDWARGDGGAGQGIYQHLAPAMPSSVRIAGLETGKALSPNHVTNKICIKRFDEAGDEELSSCSFWNKGTQKFALTINVSEENWTAYSSSSLLSKAYSIPWFSARPEVRYACPDYVDSCSFLRLTGPADVCNLNDTYTYRSHKNKTCGQPTRWTIPDGVNIVSQTDSALVVKFPNFGRYKIFVEAPFACNPLSDSVIVEVVSKSPPLTLGPDTSICQGNTLILHAGALLYGYQWSDGSTDSTLEITGPGIYWVEAMDECGNLLRDTVAVTISARLPLSIGDDRVKCNADTIHLQAPSGFLNYAWAPDYNISSLTAQNIVVNPRVDTSYYLRAEKAAGCFAYDTIRISVNQSPVINLGADTSICYNDVLLLDAGNGFNSYVWNNGESGQTLQVKEKGTYSVTATNSEGCRSADTLVIQQVFSLPVPVLNKDIVLCKGIPYILSAGTGYKHYAWSDGSSGPEIAINSLGAVSVVVEDVNGCFGTDTTIITRMESPPGNFLPTDTAICYYDLFELKPLLPFARYLWSNGTTGSVITVSQPGNYWLEVTDNNQCKGLDSITIQQKECMDGFFIPNAFTPNNDGLNDVFKPLLYGPAGEYTFVIFDRWGKIVFQSKVIGEGWDGTVKGIPQNSGLFVWTCSFKLQGSSQAEKRNGSMLLIR